MEMEGEARSSVQVEIEKLGGITETAVEFEPGVTVLTGRNATNRTSFLRAIMAALGSDAAAVKGDASDGSVSLELDGTTYTRTLSKRNDATVFGGDPYLEDAELAELFAFLLESNDARQAIERGANLYDVIMRPVDTADIDTRISELEGEREGIETELEAIASLEARLPELEEQRTQLDAQVAAKQDELESKRAELDELDTGGDTPSELEDRFEDLRETRSELEGVRNDIDDQRRIIEALREDRAEIESELEGLAAVDADEEAAIQAEIKRHRETVQSIESTLNDLQAVIQFNESLADGDTPSFVRSLQGEVDSEADGGVTDQLVEEGQNVVCWTCGSDVDGEEIERTLGILREVHSEKIDHRTELRDEIDELEAERKHIVRTRDEKRRLEGQLTGIERDLDDRTNRLSELEAEAETLEGTVSDLEAEIDELEPPDHDDLLDLHREVNELGFEVNRLERQLSEVEGEIESVEERIDEREQLEAQREEITDEIESLRTRIERLESTAVEQFNDRMEQILELLEFDNLERIWIERVEREVENGRRKESRPSFDLHVVRTSESGSVYEDTIEHLSESEREVVGLVFALSGYLVHEVYEEVPFMLLDSLEALDAERIATLIDYLAEYAPNIVVALLSEDAAAVDESYERITEI